MTAICSLPLTAEAAQRLIDLHISAELQLALDDLVYDHGEAMGLDGGEISHINNGGPLQQLGWLASEAEMDASDFRELLVPDAIIDLALLRGNQGAASHGG